MNFRLTKSSLNFKVYTSPTIPASGTENDIVIISSTPMENWILSSDAPTGEPMNNGDVWIQYSVSGNVFDIMNQHDFMLAITKIYQYVSGTWVSVDARRYVGGVWDVVSSAFSATINITYPANSNCVVTNSGGQTVASDTNTTSSTKTWTATVNATGTYTVAATATDGSGNTKSESVEITNDGQSVSVTLSYRYYLFKEGEGVADNWGTAGNATLVQKNNNAIAIESTAGYGGNNNHKAYILADLSEYKTLKAEIETTVADKPIVGVFGTVEPTLYTGLSSYTSAATNGIREVVSLDISSFSGEQYVGILVGNLEILYMYNFWLE